jgi:NADP-dependent 3-hydroxy acid dehydrogenase YdfG
MKKVVLITGSSTGFGTLMAKTFDQSGYQVIATMREPDGKNATAAR